MKVSEDDFERIEQKMREHIKAGEPSSATTCRPRTRSKRFIGEGEDYKVELIEDLIKDEGEETVSLYRNGPFTDLCRGPHAPTHQADQGVQADVGRRRLLARRRRTADAHADLRHGVPLEGGPRPST